MRTSNVIASISCILWLGATVASAETAVIYVPARGIDSGTNGSLGTASVVTPDATHDTMVFEGSPTTNYCSSNQFEIGTYNTDEAIGYLNFENIPLTASDTVTRVALRIYKNSENNSSPNHDFYFAQVNQSWSECSINWNNRPSIDNLSIYGRVNLAGGTGWYEIDLPVSYATREINSPNSWHGIAIGPWQSDTDLLRFRSSEATSGQPYLIVEYETTLPDLVVASCSAPSQAAANGTITVSAVVQNTGTGWANSSRLGYYISRRTYYDGTAILLDDDSVSSLDPGETSSESQSLNLGPAGLSAANNPYYILFVADHEHVVTESNETNNTCYRQIMIQSPPVIGSLTSSLDPVFESEGFVLYANNVTDANSDVQRVDFWWDSFQDGVFDPNSDYLLGSDTIQGTWSMSVPVGSVVSGNLLFFAVAWDAFGLNSNTASRAVRVVPSLYPVVDTNKPGQWNETMGSLTRFFADGNGDGLHSPGEILDVPASGAVEGEDNSCWMAAAANLVAYRYGSAAFNTWCASGLVVSPVWDLFGGQHEANSGNKRTFDDGGYPQWVLRALDIPLARPLTTDLEFEGGVWPENPIAWCKSALENNDRPIAICFWWGQQTSSAVPSGRKSPDDPGYHCVTVWGVDDVAHQILITDSDDDYRGTPDVPNGGARRVAYSYANGRWTLFDLYDSVPEARVNSACITTNGLNDISGVPDASPSGDLIQGLCASPNPLNPSTTISFELLTEQTVDLDVYDVQGRLVRRLVSAAQLGSGRHELTWNGADSNGLRVASGVYLYRIDSGQDHKIGRCLVLK